MLYSAEIRWFFQTTDEGIPESRLEWFKRGYAIGDSGLAAERARADYYLRFPQCDTVGVKLRGVPGAGKNNFEIKALFAPPRLLEHGETVRGRTDQWVKWSSDRIELPAVGDAAEWNGEQWIRVGKTRYLRKFSIDGGKPQEVAADERPAAGCNVELTALDTDGAARFRHSLGFEAFGPPARIHSILVETLGFFFATAGAPPAGELGIENSLSYPTWLATR
ncbi:MAG: hypothetical protein JSS81_10955 [Acidobacteria bacterium]|nr:hypothetical protein [Acidobacteriota bacterium]